MAKLTRFRVVTRPSEFTDKKVFVLQLKKRPDLFKGIAFGERAEFKTKSEAKKFAIQTEKIIRRATK